MDMIKVALYATLHIRYATYTLRIRHRQSICMHSIRNSGELGMQLHACMHASFSSGSHGFLHDYSGHGMDAV
jgi:hypothetical protein